MLLAVIIGVTIGIGLPSTLAYFADSTNIAKRGIHGGITWLVVGIGGLSIGANNSYSSKLTCSVLTFLLVGEGLDLFCLFYSQGKTFEAKKATHADSFIQILSRREFLLYLAPWIMFSVINFVEAPFHSNVFGSLATLLGFVELAISGVFALVGGILADRVGRKRVVITGFIILGIEYAILSISGFFGSYGEYNRLSICLFRWYCLGYVCICFFHDYLGRFSWRRNKREILCNRWITLSSGRFLISHSSAVSTIIMGKTGGLGMSFTLASFFLFIAVLPLIYAPETLPEKIMKENDLKKYVEKALEKVQKKPVGTEKKNSINDKSDEPKDEINKFDEEAQKLAEKYY